MVVKPRTLRSPRRAAAALALLASALATPAAAQNVSQTQPLDFGRVALGSGSGSVTVTPAGAATCGPHYCLGSHQSASFQVSGLSLLIVDISFSSGNVLTLQGGGGTLDLVNLVDSRGGSFRLSLLGTGSFDVGGDLVVPNTTAAGLYDGIYEVFVDYQ